SALDRVAVLVVTHNSASTLLQCLEPLAGKVEIVVVDNASSDSSADIAAGLPGVEVVRSVQNLGLGAGSNRAAARISRELLLLLNPDCVPPAEAVERLAEALLASPELGFAGPQIR